MGVGCRCLARDDTLVRLFCSHRAKLVRFAAHLGVVDAEDVVAEAFTQVYQSWHRLHDNTAAAAYLRSTVHNLARMRLRRMQVERRHVERVLVEVESAESVVLVREDRRAVVDALAELAPRQREAVVLRYWLDLKEVEVAAAMGITVGAVKAHLSRALASLATALCA